MGVNKLGLEMKKTVENIQSVREQSDASDIRSKEAKQESSDAKQQSQLTQAQMDSIARGSTTVEMEQARVDADGHEYDVFVDRINHEQRRIDKTQLKQENMVVDMVADMGADPTGQVPCTDLWETVINEDKIAFFPNPDGKHTYTIDDWLLDTVDGSHTIKAMSQYGARTVIKQITPNKGFFRQRTMLGNSALTLVLADLRLNGNSTSENLVHVDAPGFAGIMDRIEFDKSGKSGLYGTKWTPYNFAFRVDMYRIEASGNADHGIYLNGIEQGSLRDVHAQQNRVGIALSGFVDAIGLKASFNTETNLRLFNSETGIQQIAKIDGYYSEGSKVALDVDGMTTGNITGFYGYRPTDEGTLFRARRTHGFSVNGNFLMGNDFSNRGVTAVDADSTCSKVKVSGVMEVTNSKRGRGIKDQTMDGIDTSELSVIGEVLYPDKNLFQDAKINKINDSNMAEPTVNSTMGGKGTTVIKKKMLNGTPYRGNVLEINGTGMSAAVSVDADTDYLLVAYSFTGNVYGRLLFDTQASANPSTFEFKEYMKGWGLRFAVRRPTKTINTLIRYDNWANGYSYLKELHCIPSLITSGGFDIDADGDGVANDWLVTGTPTCNLQTARQSVGGSSQYVKGDINNYIYQQVRLFNEDGRYIIAYYADKGTVIKVQGDGVDLTMEAGYTGFHVHDIYCPSTYAQVKVYSLTGGTIDDLAIIEMNKGEF